MNRLPAKHFLPEGTRESDLPAYERRQTVVPFTRGTAVPVRLREVSPQSEPRQEFVFLTDEFVARYMRTTALRWNKFVLAEPVTGSPGERYGLMVNRLEERFYRER